MSELDPMAVVRRFAELEDRIRKLEQDSHPPIDLTPLVKELVRAELQGPPEH